MTSKLADEKTGKKRHSNERLLFCKKNFAKLYCFAVIFLASKKLYLPLASDIARLVRSCGFIPFFDKKIIFKKIFRNFKIFVDNNSILVYIVIVNDNHYQ